jgi:hypothetical protein
MNYWFSFELHLHHGEKYGWSFSCMSFIEAPLTTKNSTINLHLGCQIVFQYNMLYERNIIYQEERYEHHQRQRQSAPKLRATSIPLSSQCISMKVFSIFSTCPICSPPSPILFDQFLFLKWVAQHNYITQAVKTDTSDVLKSTGPATTWKNSIPI